MNWLAFAIAAWVACGFEYGLRDAFRLGETPVAPSFLLILAVFVCLWASPGAVLSACLIIGMLMDFIFLQQIQGTEQWLTILGPHALGLLLGGYAVLNMRALMFRRNALALAFLCIVAGALMHILAWALLYLRGVWGDPVFGGVAGELGYRLAGAVYTGVMALVIGLILGLVRPVFGFPADTKRGFKMP